MKDPQNLIASANPIVLFAVGVVAVGSIVGLSGYVIFKLKTSPDSIASRLFQKAQSYLLYNPLIASVQVSYLTLAISTGRLFETNIAAYRSRNANRQL